MDIAKVGFSAETSELKEAQAALRALAPAAASTAKAVDTLNKSTAGITGAVGAAAGGIKSFDSAVKTAAAGTSTFNKAALSAGTAMGTVGAAATGAAARLNVLNGATMSSGTAMLNAGSHVEAYKAHIASLPPAVDKAKSSLDRLGAAANDNINKMQSTPGNIAAQFQDIGVTAAGGMSPMLIALQQGTQLSAAFAGGMGGIGAALKQMFSPMALLTIGAVGLIAALIQMVDWAAFAKSALNTLADIVEASTPYLLAFAGAMALIYSPAIISGLATLAVGFYNLAASILLSIGLPVLLVAGLLAIVAAANYFRDDLTKIFGVDIVGAAKTGVNFIIGAFVGAFNAIRATWRMLPSAIGDVVIQAANMVIKTVENMVNGSITLINGLLGKLPFGIGDNMQMGNVSFGAIPNPLAGFADATASAAVKAVGDAQGKDYVGAFVAGAQSLGSWAAGKLRGLAAGLGEDGKPGKHGATPRTPKGPKPEKTDAEKFTDILADADKKMRALVQAGDQIGVYGEALARMKHEQELFNAAQDKGITLTTAMTAELKKRAAEMAAQETLNTKRGFMEDLIQGAEQKQFDLERERGEIGLTTAATAAWKYETEMLTAARQKHIELTPTDLAAISATAAAYGQQADTVRKLKEQYEFARGTAKGFFTDLFEGVQQGKSIWSAFADAAINALNRIIAKLMDRTIEMLLDQIFSKGAGGGGGGGFFGSLLGSIGGGMSGGASSGNWFDPLPSAGKWDMNAKGGVFDGPTGFNSSRGPQIAGEAGPEAAMPLTRGPDGSLGVRAFGGGAAAGPAPVVVTVNNDNRVTGAVSSQDIVNMQKASAERTKTEIAKALPYMIQQHQRDGAMV